MCVGTSDSGARIDRSSHAPRALCAQLAGGISGGFPWSGGTLAGGDHGWRLPARVRRTAHGGLPLTVCVCRFSHNRHATTRAATFTGDVDTGATFYSTEASQCSALESEESQPPGRGRRLSHRVAHVRCDHGRSAALLAAACRNPQRAVVLPSPSDGVGGEEVKSGAGETLTTPRRCSRSCTCDQAR